MAINVVHSPRVTSMAQLAAMAGDRQSISQAIQFNQRQQQLNLQQQSAFEKVREAERARQFTRQRDQEQFKRQQFQNRQRIQVQQQENQFQNTFRQMQEWQQEGLQGLEAEITQRVQHYATGRYEPAGVNEWNKLQGKLQAIQRLKPNMRPNQYRDKIQQWLTEHDASLLETHRQEPPVWDQLNSMGVSASGATINKMFKDAGRTPDQNYRDDLSYQTEIRSGARAIVPTKQSMAVINGEIARDNAYIDGQNRLREKFDLPPIKDPGNPSPIEEAEFEAAKNRANAPPPLSQLLLDNRSSALGYTKIAAQLKERHQDAVNKRNATRKTNDPVWEPEPVTAQDVAAEMIIQAEKYDEAIQAARESEGAAATTTPAATTKPAATTPRTPAAAGKAAGPEPPKFAYLDIPRFNSLVQTHNAAKPDSATRMGIGRFLQGLQTEPDKPPKAFSLATVGGWDWKEDGNPPWLINGVIYRGIDKTDGKEKLYKYAAPKVLGGVGSFSESTPTTMGAALGDPPTPPTKKPQSLNMPAVTPTTGDTSSQGMDEESILALAAAEAGGGKRKLGPKPTSYSPAADQFEAEGDKWTAKAATERVLGEITGLPKTKRQYRGAELKTLQDSARQLGLGEEAEMLLNTTEGQLGNMTQNAYKSWIEMVQSLFGAESPEAGGAAAPAPSDRDTGLAAGSPAATAVNMATAATASDVGLYHYLDSQGWEHKDIGKILKLLPRNYTYKDKEGNPRKSPSGKVMKDVSPKDLVKFFTDPKAFPKAYALMEETAPGKKGPMPVEQFLPGSTTGLTDEQMKGMGEQVGEPSAVDEDKFQTWYGKYAKQQGLNPNPDDERHHYDYRAAYKAGAKPDDSGHWPSKYKKDTHPDLIKGGVNTKTGEPAEPKDAKEQFYEYGLDKHGNKVSGASSESDKYRNAASKHSRDNNHSKAIAAMGQALNTAAEKNKGDLLVHLARYQIDAGNFADATASLNKARQHMDAHGERGFASSKMLEVTFDSARAGSKERKRGVAADLKTKRGEAAELRKKAVEKSGDEKIKLLTSALKLDSQSHGASVSYHSRADAYYNDKKYDKAISDYTSSIRIDPNYAPVYRDRADAYGKKKEWASAIADYTESIDRSKPLEKGPSPERDERVELYLRRATAYTKNKEPKKAAYDKRTADNILQGK